MLGYMFVCVVCISQNTSFYVPIWLSASFSHFMFFFSQWNSLPEHAPVPGSSSEAILVSSALRLDGELLAMDGVD